MKISLQIILFLSFVVLNIKSKNIEIFDVLQMKSLVNIHFDLSEAIDNSLNTNLNKKKKLLSRLMDIDLKLANYAKISSANMMKPLMSGTSFHRWCWKLFIIFFQLKV